MTADIKLLPLPELASERVFGAKWDDFDMQDYARANVAHATAAKDAEIEALRVEVERRTAHVIVHRGAALACSDTVRSAYSDEHDRAERLAEALRWYANPEVYKPHPHGPAFDDRDLSFKARAALRDHDQEGGNP